MDEPLAGLILALNGSGELGEAWTLARSHPWVTIVSLQKKVAEIGPTPSGF
jgi:hypothetical protein